MSILIPVQRQGTIRANVTEPIKSYPLQVGVLPRYIKGLQVFINDEEVDHWIAEMGSQYVWVTVDFEPGEEINIMLRYNKMGNK